MPLPEGYTGFVLHKDAAELDGEAGRRWQTTGSFRELSYWNHDTPSSAMDSAPRALEWLALSTAVSPRWEMQHCSRTVVVPPGLIAALLTCFRTHNFLACGCCAANGCSPSG